MRDMTQSRYATMTESLLKSVGAQHNRTGKRGEVWVLPDGKKFTVQKANNGKEYRSDENTYALLCRLLKSVPTYAGAVPVKPKKKVRATAEDANRLRSFKPRGLPDPIPATEMTFEDSAGTTTVEDHVNVVETKPKNINTVETEPAPMSTSLIDNQPVAEPEPEKPHHEIVLMRTPEKANSAVFTYPPDVLGEASRILQEHGQFAYQTFLTEHRNAAVPVTAPTSKKPEKQVVQPSEIRVEAAKRQIACLRAANAAADNAIASAKAEIVKQEQIKLDNNASINKLTQFIDAYTLFMEEGDKIDSLLSSVDQFIVKQTERQAEKQSAKPHGSCPLRWAEIVAIIKPMIERESGASISEMHAAVLRVNANVSKESVSNALVHYMEKNPDHGFQRTGWAKAARWVANRNQQLRATAGAA